MPNGGTDCCALCSWNRATHQLSWRSSEHRQRFFELSHCLLRDANITSPFWTYCRNYRPLSRGVPREVDFLTQRPTGPIMGSGRWEDGYTRIPWNGKNEPRKDLVVDCDICGRRVLQGLKVDHEGSRLGFCSNRHYVEWWVGVHGPDPRLRPESVMPPEELFGEQKGDEEEEG